MLNDVEEYERAYSQVLNKREGDEGGGTRIDF